MHLSCLPNFKKCFSCKKVQTSILTSVEPSTNKEQRSEDPIPTADNAVDVKTDELKVKDIVNSENVNVVS